MGSFEEILDRIFNPIILATANFIAFGIIFAYGIISSNPSITYAGTGFFIAGASIGVLAIVGRWIERNETEYEEETPEAISPVEPIKGGVKDGVPKRKDKVYTTIEI